MNIIFVIYHPSYLSNWVEKLLPYLNNSKVYVFHPGRLHKVIPKKSEGITLYDVSGYSYNESKKLINEIRPDVMAFHSFRSPYLLTYQRICRKLNIPQIYFEDGLFTQDVLKFKSNKIKNDFVLTVKRQISFLSSYFSYLCHADNKVSEVKLFYKVYFKGQFRLNPFDHYFLYGDRSIENLGKVFNLTKGDNVTLVGYPIFKEESQKIEAESRIANGKDILYVHQPLIQDGLTDISYEQERDYLLSIYESLKLKYGDFYLLLHPRSDVNHYKKIYENTPIKVVQAPNNYLLFADKGLVIGHYSTALLYGLYFGKKTIVMAYPGCEFENVFANIFDYIAEAKMLCSMKPESSAIQKEYYVGTGNTYEGIAHAIVNYVEKF